MRLPELVFVVPDGLNGGRLQVTGAQMRWQYGVDVVQPVRVVHQDGTAYSLAGAVAAILAFYENDSDDLPTLQLEWDIVGANTAEFSFLRGMAQLLPITDRGYLVGARFRDDDLDLEDAVLVPGRAVVDKQLGSFDLPVAVTTTTPALARGAAGPNFTPTDVQTADYAAEIDELVVCDPTAATFVVTLPDPVASAGRRVGVVIAAVTPNPVTIEPAGAETINGAASLSLEMPWVVVTFVAVGGNWIAW